jgi:hypothetical protein
VLKDCRREVDQTRDLVLWNHVEKDGSTYFATQINRFQTPAIQTLLALRDEYDAMRRAKVDAEDTAKHAAERRAILGDLHRAVMGVSRQAIDRAVVAKTVLMDIVKIEQRDRHHRAAMALAQAKLGRGGPTIEGLTSAELDGLLKGGDEP